ncbi:MAG: zinc-binding dehydrogenase [Pirellulaceae bacterium]|nr:zinc-binding dehydrogenase [Pirellulaceae bacterium]
MARGRAEFIQAPQPQARPGFVVVRTSHVSLCGSDIRMLHFAPPSSYPFPPGTTGHEMVGVVHEVANDDSPFSVGDRVLALAPEHQAMCEYYLAPEHLVIPLPQGKPLEVLLQAQQLGTVMYAAQRLPNVMGRSVAILGQGSAGLWFNFILRRMGAAQVIALDADPHRLKYSQRFGATHQINNAQTDPVERLHEILGGHLPDIVVEAAGETQSINLSLELVKKFGQILFFGYPRCQHMDFNFELFFHKCCQATTIVGATEEDNQASSRQAIELINQDSSLAELLITHRLSFDDVLTAYDMHRTRADHCLKIVIEMPSAVQ